MPVFIFFSYLHTFISHFLLLGLTCTPKRTMISLPQSHLPNLSLPRIPNSIICPFILFSLLFPLSLYISLPLLLNLYIPSSLSNCVVSMHLQVLLFLIDTKLDLVRITFTLNIWCLQSEEKKKMLSQLFTAAMPSINNQQYWKKNSCRFYYYSIPHPLSITITDSRYTKDWFMKQNSFSCVGQDIYVFTQNILYNKTSVFAQQD